MKKINQFAVIISLFTALLFFAGSRSALADENTITTVHIGTDIFTVFENGEIKAEKSDTIISDGLKANILGMAYAQGPDKPTVPNKESTGYLLILLKKHRNKKSLIPNQHKQL